MHYDQTLQEALTTVLASRLWTSCNFAMVTF